MLNSWILSHVRTSHEQVSGSVNVPKASNQPFQSLDRRHETNRLAHKVEEGLDALVEGGILLLGHLCPVCFETLVAE